MREGLGVENSNKRIPAEQTLLKENRAGEPWEKSRARALYYPRPIFDVKKKKPSQVYEHPSNKILRTSIRAKWLIRSERISVSAE